MKGGGSCSFAVMKGGGKCNFALMKGGGRCSFAVLKGASYRFFGDERGVYSFLCMKRANVQQGEVYSTVDEGTGVQHFR